MSSDDDSNEDFSVLDIDPGDGLVRQITLITPLIWKNNTARKKIKIAVESYFFDKDNFSCSGNFRKKDKHSNTNVNFTFQFPLQVFEVREQF